MLVLVDLRKVEFCRCGQRASRSIPGPQFSTEDVRIKTVAQRFWTKGVWDNYRQFPMVPPRKAQENREIWPAQEEGSKVAEKTEAETIRENDRSGLQKDLKVINQKPDKTWVFRWMPAGRHDSHHDLAPWKPPVSRLHLDAGGDPGCVSSGVTWLRWSTVTLWY